MQYSEPHFVYVLVSLRDGNCYVGRTNNLLRRYGQHAGGMVASTRRRRPLLMVHWELLPNKKAAIRREQWLKSPAASAFKARLRAQGSAAGDVAQLGEH